MGRHKVRSELDYTKSESNKKETGAAWMVQERRVRRGTHWSQDVNSTLVVAVLFRVQRGEVGCPGGGKRKSRIERAQLRIESHSDRSRRVLKSRRRIEEVAQGALLHFGCAGGAPSGADSVQNEWSRLAILK